MKNQALESDQVITLDTARLMTIRESNFTQNQDKRDKKNRIIPELLIYNQKRISESTSSEERKTSKENSYITEDGD
jgi:hypothetical protein